MILKKKYQRQDFYKPERLMFFAGIYLLMANGSNKTSLFKNIRGLIMVAKTRNNNRLKKTNTLKCL